MLMLMMRTWHALPLLQQQQSHWRWRRINPPSGRHRDLETKSLTLMQHPKPPSLTRTVCLMVCTHARGCAVFRCAARAAPPPHPCALSRKSANRPSAAAVMYTAALQHTVLQGRKGVVPARSRLCVGFICRIGCQKNDKKDAVASVRYGKALTAFVESASKNGTQVTQSYACVNGGDIIVVVYCCNYTDTRT